MTLIKVSSQDFKSTKLISANDLKSLREKAEEKFGYKIEKFKNKSNQILINDNDSLAQLIKNETDVWLIALRKKSEKSVKVSTNKLKRSASFNSSSLEHLKKKIESEFKIDICKFVRKEDGAEIEDNEIFIELLNSEKELWLIVLQKDEEFELENDESNYFLDECDELESNIKAFKSTDLVSSSTSKPYISTVEVEKRKIDIEKRLKLEEQKKEAKLKQLEELNKMSATLEREKAEREELEKKYRIKLFTNQVTRETSKTELSRAEAKLLELDLKKKRIANIFYELRQAEKVDICFMLDCTGSMASYITEAKSVIHRTIDKLEKKFQYFQLRASFVGYRDHSDGENRITAFNFSEKIDSFKSFVSSVSANGGADECEDIFGALEEVNKLDWLNMSRILFHIGDAPCHGSRFHSSRSDDYPAGDPRGLNINDLLKGIVTKHISYYFAEINNSTIKMIEEFDRVLLSLNGNKINLLDLKSADGLTELVTKSIITTITESKSMSMHSAHGKAIKDIIVDPTCLGFLSDRMKKYKADYYVAKYTGEIEELKDKSFEFEKKSVEIYLAEKPFAKGSLRFAYSGLLDGKIKSVLKQSLFKDPEYNTLKNHKDLIENQVVAAFLARVFNSNILKTEKPVRFIDVNLIHIVEEGLFFSIEEFISGTFVKWMNNAGIINEDIYSCTLDAFSHWSYQATDEYLIVTDLQGMLIENKEYILTDPAITSPEGHDRFSSTNLGIKGVQKFFETHKCNYICKHLNLKKHKYQSRPDREYSSMMTRLI